MHTYRGARRWQRALPPGSYASPSGGSKPDKSDRWSQPCSYGATAEGPIPVLAQPTEQVTHLSIFSVGLVCCQLEKKAFGISRGNHKFVWRGFAGVLHGKSGLGVRKNENQLSCLWFWKADF